jgi:hypothetical protein
MNNSQKPHKKGIFMNNNEAYSSDVHEFEKIIHAQKKLGFLEIRFDKQTSHALKNHSLEMSQRYAIQDDADVLNYFNMKRNPARNPSF